MTEFIAQLRYLWIEHGDTAAAVLIVVAFAVFAIVALSKGGKHEAD